MKRHQIFLFLKKLGAAAFHWTGKVLLSSWLINIASFSAWAILLAALWQSCEKTQITQPAIDKADTLSVLNSSKALKGGGWTDSSYSKLGIVKHGDSYDKILRNHSYLHAYLPSTGARDSSEIVISQILTQVVSGEGNSKMPFIQTRAYVFAKGQMGDVLWELESPGSSGEIFNGFYRVERKECCGLGKFYSLYNLFGGQKVISYSNSFLKVETSDKRITRLLGLKSGASSHLEIYEEDPLYIGTISYASPEGKLELAVLKARNKAEKTTLENSISLGFSALLNPGISEDMVFGKNQLRLPAAPLKGDNVPLCTVSLNLGTDNNILDIPVYPDSMGFSNVRSRGYEVDVITPALPIASRIK